MCSSCGWRELVRIVKDVVAVKHPEIGERQQTWLETIAITVDDDRHCTDHQKTVIRRILKERKLPEWRLVPKACDKTKWSDAKKQRFVERKKMARRLRRHGGF